MKMFFLIALIMSTALFSCNEPVKTDTPESQPPKTETVSDSTDKSLFMDVHDLEPGKVTFADVMAAHQKDLATGPKYGVSFMKFWVDEKKGKVYCLSTAKDSLSIAKTHAEAHGLLPSAVYKVTDGPQANAIAGEQYFLDVHNVGAGKVTAAAVKEAHGKDLATQGKYKANFVNYWLDEKSGTIFCLVQAPDSNALIHTHKEAHGLLPAYVMQVKQGE